jgi:hypothetical protein
MKQSATPNTLAKGFKFTDALGRTWDVTLTLAGAMRIDASDFSEVTSLKFSMLEPTREFITALLTDTPLCFAVIFALVQPQVKTQLGIDPQESPEAFNEAQKLFLEGLTGPVIVAGKDTLWGAVSDFFPDQQTALSMLHRQYREARQRVGKAIQGMDTEITNLFQQEVDKGLANFQNELRSLSAVPHGIT